MTQNNNAFDYKQDKTFAASRFINNSFSKMKNNIEGCATFDVEMQRHGLINDLKKLDSFNKFIEQHSPL